MVTARMHHFICFVLFIGGVSGKPKCPKFATEENGSCYWIIPYNYRRPPPMTGYQAAAHAECGQVQPGAGLATINDVNENNFIFDWVTRFSVEPRPVWIGLYQPRIPNHGPVWLSGERGILDLVEPLEYGEGAVLFLIDPRRFGPRWDAEDPYEWGIGVSALCEYKLPRVEPTTPPSTTVATRNLPVPTTSRTAGGPRRNMPRRPPTRPFGPGPLYLRNPVAFGGILREVKRPAYTKETWRERLAEYNNGHPVAIP